MARTAEVIYVGDAASLIKASQAAADAAKDAADQISGANDAIASSYGEALAAARDAYKTAADGASALGGSLEEQAAIASAAADSIMGSYGRIDKAAADAGAAAARTAATIGASLDEQRAAYADAANAAVVAADKQSAALGEVAARSRESAGVVTASTAESASSFDVMADGMLAMVPGWGTLAAVLAGVAVESVKMAANFEQAMTRVQTEAGASSKEVANFSKEILALAGHTEQTPKAMAEGLFWIASAGLKGKAAIDALKTSNELADVSGANLSQTAKTLTTVIDDLHQSTSQYAGDAGVLNATIGAGKLTMEEYTHVLGPVLVAAQAAGIGLEEVSASFAAVTRMGIGSAKAATGLRQAFQHLAAIKEYSSKEDEEKGKLSAAGEAIHNFGMTADQVAAELRKPDGFMHVVDELHDKLAKMSGAELSTGLRDVLELAGGVRSGTVLQALVEHPVEHAKTNEEILANLASFHAKTIAQEHTFSGELKETWSGIEGDMIRAGNAIKSILPNAFTIATGLIKVEGDLMLGHFSDIGKDTGTILGRWGLDITGIVEGWGTSLYHGGVTAFVELEHSIDTQAGPIIQAVDKIGSGVTTAVESIVPGMVKAGENIVDGLEQGISSEASKALSTVTGLANKLASAFNSAVGNLSPSRVFRTSGENIAEGLVQGLLSKQQDVTYGLNQALIFPVDAAITALKGKEKTLEETTKRTTEAVEHSHLVAELRAAERGTTTTTQSVSSGSTLSGSGAVTRYAAIADEMAKRYGENPALLLADINQESGGNPAAVSSAGAQGLTQFMPSTAEEYGVKYGTTLEDIRSQIAGQAKYLASLGVNRNPSAALEAYSGNTPGYAESVLSQVKNYEDLKTASDRITTSVTHSSSAIHKAKEALDDFNKKAAEAAKLAKITIQVEHLEQLNRWTEAIENLKVKTSELAGQAAKAWETLEGNAITKKHAAALEAIETGANVAGLKADEAAETAERTSREEKELAKRLKEAKWTGNKEEVEKAEEAITQFKRQQDEKQRKEKEEAEAKAANSAETVEQNALESRTKAYEAMLNQQLNALTVQLQHAQINYSKYAQEVNKILAANGVAGVGLVTSPGEEAAITQGAGPLAPSEPPFSTIGKGGYEHPVAHASGGLVYPGIEYEVGETGPERFTAASAGSIAPARASASQQAALGGNHIHVAGDMVFHNRRDVDKAMHKLAHKLRYGGH